MNGPAPVPFSVTVSESGEAVVVVLVGELDIATAPEAEAAVLPPCRAGRHAVLDLRRLDFMDSTGVRVIVAAHLAAEEHGGRFSIVRTEPGSAVDRVLKVSGLDGMLDVVDEV